MANIRAIGVGVSLEGDEVTEAQRKARAEQLERATKVSREAKAKRKAAGAFKSLPPMTPAEKARTDRQKAVAAELAKQGKATDPAPPADDSSDSDA